MRKTNEEIIELLKLRKSGSSNENIDEIIYIEYKDIADRLSRKYSTDSIYYDDLFQEASISILNAINNFDYTKNLSFKEFVEKRIEKDLLSYIEEEKKYLAQSEYISKFLNKIIDTENNLYKSLKRFPTEDEVASRLNIDIYKLREYKSYALDLLNMDKTVDNLKLSLREIISHNNPKNDNDITDDEFEMLNLSLNTLNDTEKDIIMMYYGLNGIEKKTKEEIEEIYDISSEKLRQLISKIERKLKSEMEDNYD